MPSTSSLVMSWTRPDPDDLAIFHHSHAVRKVEHIVDVVADKEDADALGLELLDELADLGRLGGPKRRRRLIHDQDTGVKMDRSRDGDRLALAARERDHRLLEAAEIGIEPSHDLARFRLHRGVVQRPQRVRSSRPR